MGSESRSPRRAVWTVLTILAGTAAPAGAQSSHAVIELGLSDGLAIDQPRTFFRMIDPDTGQIHGPSEGFDAALLDTGANGIVLAQRSYIDDDFTVNPDRYNVQTDPDTGQTIQYPEIGVGGWHNFDLLEPYDIAYNGLSGRYESDGTAHTIEGAVAIGDPNIDFGGFAGIIGMPGMMDRRTEMDMTTLLDPDPDVYYELPYIDAFLDELPDPQALTSSEDTATNEYAVDLRMWEYEPEPVDGADPLPTFEPLPFVDRVGLADAGQNTTADMILDTGAQLSMIATDIAHQLGIDPEEDAIDHITLGGVGGSVTAPIVELDHLSIPTVEGVDLQLSQIRVAVLDIGDELEDFDFQGIFGMNLLTSGYAEPVLDLLGGSDVSDAAGYLDKSSLEFLRESDTGEALGRMFLEVNEAYHDPQLQGDLTGSGFVGGDDLDLVLSNWGVDGEDLPEDWVNFRPAADEIVGGDQLDLILSNWGQQVSTSVPEPTSLFLLASGAVLLARRIRRYPAPSPRLSSR